jgi:hypothetical protein
MNLLELSALIQDEKKCEEYLGKVSIIKNIPETFCQISILGRVVGQTILLN